MGGVIEYLNWCSFPLLSQFYTNVHQRVFPLYATFLIGNEIVVGLKVLLYPIYWVQPGYLVLV
jgi:hypothetical protein